MNKDKRKMDVQIDTPDPDSVSASHIAEVLEKAGYFVATVEVRDAETLAPCDSWDRD